MLKFEETLRNCGKFKETCGKIYKLIQQFEKKINKKCKKLRFYGCKVEAYGAQSEFKTKICKLKLQFPLCSLRFYFTSIEA